MEEVAELLLLPTDSEDGEEIDDDDDDDDDDDAAPPCPARRSAPASSLDRQIHRHHSRRRFDYRHLDPGTFVPVFSSPGLPSSPFFRIGRGTPVGSVSCSDSDDLGDQAALALDLFDPCTPRRRGGMELDPFRDGMCPVRFGALDGVEDVGSDYDEPGRGLALGFGVEKLRGEEGGFAGVDMEEGSDWGDGLLVGRRSVVLGSGCCDGEPSSSRDCGGLSSIVGFGSDLDSDDEGEGDVAGSLHSDDLDVPDGMGDRGLPLCWDCLRIEEESRDLDEDFDWEEVDGRVDEREVLSAVMGAAENTSMVQEVADVGLEIEGQDDEEEVAVRNIEWEVLLDVNDLERNAAVEHDSAESYLGEEHEGFVYTSEYEILVGQFGDHESSIKGNPPAAKSVVERLPLVVLTQVDAANNNTLCAVCKDEILMEEKAKRLPCSHHYHADCILQWLGIRNTCPVCRYELPTDDPNYENWRVQRASSGRAVDESHVWHNFEIFHGEWGT